MTNKQRAKIDSYNRIAKFNSIHAADLATIPEYAAELTIFNTAFAAINAAASMQAKISGKGIVPVTDVKGQMAAVVIQFALRGMVKAKQLNNVTLANELNVPLSFITHATKVLAVQRANNTRNLLNDNIATLTNIALADITAMDAAIAAYDSLKDEPVETIQLKKANGTDALPNLISTIDEAVDNMYSLVQSYFADTAPNMVNEMQLAIEIIDTGIRHTTIDFTMLDDENSGPLTNVTVTDTSNNKTYTTDENGVVHIGRHLNGHYSFSIAAAGRQTISFGADITRGTQNAFTIRLKTV